MPEKADQEMAQAIENYFATRLKYKDNPHTDAMKADCWMALMAYYAMVDVVKKRQAAVVAPRVNVDELLNNDPR